MPWRTVIADMLETDAAGLRLDWSEPGLEARYVRGPVPWSAVRDVDTGALPPEVRLDDGRTLFVSARLRKELAAAAVAAGVPQRRRPPVWSHLLEPFLDTDYELMRDIAEPALASWGFAPGEVRRIRRDAAVSMHALTALTWEWGHYGQADLLDARMRFGLPVVRRSWPAYVRLRAWSDAIAERAGPGEPPPGP